MGATSRLARARGDLREFGAIFGPDEDGEIWHVQVGTLWERADGKYLGRGPFMVMGLGLKRVDREPMVYWRSVKWLSKGHCIGKPSDGASSAPIRYFCQKMNPIRAYYDEVRHFVIIDRPGQVQ
jgi:hypothetical protein